MKFSLSVCFIICFNISNVFAQKFGYVSSDFILQKMPSYQKVLIEIDNSAQNWQKLLDERRNKVETLRKNYQNEEILLPEEIKKDRQKEIQQEEKGLQDYQNQVFGYEGLFFQKKQELIQPVQDELYKAISKVAKEKKIQIMFDKSSDLVMLYTDIRHDYTDYVLEELGLNEDANKVKDKN
jgi:outer membrane protein